MVASLLRTPRPEDTPALAQLFTDARLRQYLGGPRDMGQALISAQALVAPEREFPAWVVVQAGATEPLGFVCLDRHHDARDVEISFVLASSAQGSGIARLAVAEAIDEAWQLGLDQLVAETQSANKPAARLLEALGFTARQTLYRFGAQQVLYWLWRPTAKPAQPRVQSNERSSSSIRRPT